MYKRIFIIVMDSLGIGELPDAKDYGDIGSNTLSHIAREMDGIKVPSLESLGLGNLGDFKGISKIENPKGFHTKMKESSVGKDTMTGHWEMMGLHIKTPFRVFENGFPDELINELEEKFGRKIIGNIPASGTEIIERFGKEHMETGSLIVYTSADSVLQIAAHEGIVPLDELYKCCEIAREITLDPKYMVGRIIARPFIGEVGSFKRTSNRHDYALKPFGYTVMNQLKDDGFDVIALGKISDIYNTEGVTKSFRTVSNMDGMDKLMDSINMDFKGISFLNLVDFDAVYGHRRDAIGYGKAIEEFDERLRDALKALKEDDLLLITADHGNDPTFKGTDHTREYVPLLIYDKKNENGKEIALRESFADIGATICENFKVNMPKNGKSFLEELR